MKIKPKLLFLFFCIFLHINYAKCQNTIYLDNCETTGFNWQAVFSGPNTSYVSGNSSLADNPANSPFFSSANRGIMHQGIGNSGSGPERIIISLPIVNINPNVANCFKMKFASIGINPTVNTGAGVDNQDYLRLNVSYNGSATYSPEIQVNGGNNNTWQFNTPYLIYRTAQGSLSNYAQVVGSEYSGMVLEIPVGTSQVGFEIDLSLNAAGETWIIDDMQIVGSCYSPLPVELIYFGAMIKEGGAELTWKTATEVNNDFFEIFSSDEFGFVSYVGRVPGNGTTSMVNSYVFFDTIPKKYYRICQVDFNGNRECFGWVVTNVIEKKTNKFKIYDIYGRECESERNGVNFIIDEYGKAKKIIIY